MANQSTEQKWRDRVGRQVLSGKTVLRFCLDEGVSHTHFYQWRKRIAQASVDFVPMRVSQGILATDSDSIMRLKLEGGQLQWRGAVLPDPLWLARLLKALS